MNKHITLLAAAIGIVLAGAPAQAQEAAGGFPKVQALTMFASALPCSNVERSVAFYTRGLGMIAQPQVVMGDTVEVALAFPGGGPSLMLLHPRTDSGPLPVRGKLGRVILNVPDMKALVARLEAAGYTLLQPIREMPQYKVSVGHVADPDGNHIELVARGG